MSVGVGLSAIARGDFYVVTERLRKRGPACVAAGRHVVPGVDVATALSSILVVVMAVVLRLRYFSGLGLGDDALLRYDIWNVVRSGHVNFTPNGYRFTWWIPTALSCRLLGLTETGLITPIVAFDVLGMVLVCLFARRLWGGSGAVIAALLLAVLPLDVAWSTMLTSDILFSFFSALCVFFVLRALGEDDDAGRGRAWTLAAVALWLAYHTKVTGVLLVPALAVIGWANRRTLDATVFRFLGTAALLFGASGLVFYVLHGDVLAPFNIELRLQGLVGPEAPLHRASMEAFKIYPRWLFLPDSLGTWVYSVYPHLLIVLAVAGAALGIRPCWPVLWWLFFLFLGMELNFQRAGGVWVTGFRNVRHGLRVSAGAAPHRLSRGVPPALPEGHRRPAAARPRLQPLAKRRHGDDHPRRVRRRAQHHALPRHPAAQADLFRLPARPVVHLLGTVGDGLAIPGGRGGRSRRSTRSRSPRAARAPASRTRPGGRPSRCRSRRAGCR